MILTTNICTIYINESIYIFLEMQFSIIKHITTSTEQDYLTLFSSLVISNYIFLYDKHQLWTQKLQLIFQH